MKISVCIPTHNRPFYLQKALESVLEQTYSNYEVVISDNSNNLETQTYIKSIASTNIKYFKVNPNMTAVENQNHSVQQASFRYVTFLADDDIFEKNYLKFMSDLVQKTGVIFVRSAGKFINKKGDYIGKFDGYPYIESYKKYVSSRLNQNIISGLTGYLFTKTEYVNVGGLQDVGFPAALYTDDYLWFKISKRVGQIASTNKLLWKWRKHEDNVGSNLDIHGFINNIDNYITLLKSTFDKQYHPKINTILNNHYKRNLIKTRIKLELSRLRSEQYAKRVHLYTHLITNKLKTSLNL